MVGTSLNHYRITGVLGRGGMGEVYAAEDTKLHRQVALKVLPPSVADDPERQRRFEREAHAIAALNHANIVTIFSIEQSGDRLFLTMELVHGRPLSELMRAGGLALDRLLTLAIPLADAVSAAHQQGIVHRDLKPDNVMVADDGRLKVLDFGVARLKEAPASEDAATASQNLPLTREGGVFGTVAYMSPEQAEGRRIDSRSDIFSLGVVLYEMATGERPFKGSTALSILSSLVKDAAPDITALDPSRPGELARIVRRCLAKDPARRYQTATDVRNDLVELEQQIKSGEGAVSVRTREGGRLRGREIAAWILAALLLATTVMVLIRPRTGDLPMDVLSMMPPENTLLTEGEAPQVSPDGRTVAFVATDAAGRTLLHVRDRHSPVARPLPETDDATQPFWSPDGKSIGFFGGGQLKRIAAAGGRPLPLAPAPVPRGGTWNRDDVIVFVPFPEQPPHRISAAGGPATPLTIASDELRWFPSFLPDGRRYLFMAPGLSSGSRGVRVAALDSAETTDLLPVVTTATYVDPGYVLFRREESLVAQRLNLNTLRTEGEPITLAENVSANPITLQSLFSASSGGSLAYVGTGRGWQLTWFDRSGRRLEHVGTLGAYNSLCLSGGRRVVYDALDARSGNLDLWSLDLADGTTTRLTFETATDFYAVCSSSGDEIIFASSRRLPLNMYRLTMATPGGEQPLPRMPIPSLPTHWSRDGRLLLYSTISPTTNWDIWVLPLGGGEPFPYVATDAEEKNGQMSPNGRWVAYTTSHAGATDVYVQPFPATGSKWQVSRGGGRQPQWQPDGRQLFYISPDTKIMAVDVGVSETTFVHGAPRVSVDTRAYGGVERAHQGNPFAVAANGERLLVAHAGDETLPITVVLNWLPRP